MAIILSLLVEILTMEAEVDVSLHISKINSSSKTLISIPFFLTEDSHFQMGVATLIMHPSLNIMVKGKVGILEVIN